MTGEPRSDAPDVIVYVDHSDIHMDHLDELKEGIRRTVALLEEREPQLIAYGFHLDEELGRMTVIAVHPDSASLELHLEVGREEFRKLGAFLSLRNIEVYGTISDSVRELLEQKTEMLGGSGVTVVERFDGFARLTR